MGTQGSGLVLARARAGFGPSRSRGPVGHSRGSGLVLARAWAGLGLGFGPSGSRGPVGHSRVWPCPGPRAGGLGLGFGPSRSRGPVGHSRGSGLVLARARAALLVLALPDRGALLGTQGGLALSWPARVGGLGLGFGPSGSRGPVGHSRVWPCPGPRAGGLGLGFGPSGLRGPVGHSRGSGLVLARARAALALVLALPDRPALLGTQGGLALSWPARGRPWPCFWPFQIEGPCWALKGVWPCPGPRAGGLGLGFGPSGSRGPVGHSRGSGLVLARVRGRPWPWFWPFRIEGPCWALKGLALSWPAHGRPWPWFWPFRIEGPCWALKGVWPCPGPRAGGLGLGFGPSRSTGPVGHSRGSGPRGRPWPWFWPFQIEGPCWALKGVWPCPGPRAGGLGLGFGPSGSRGPVGHSRGSGLVLARARAALVLVLALPIGPVGHSRVWPCPGQQIDRPCWGLKGLAFVLARARGGLGFFKVFQGFSEFFSVFYRFSMFFRVFSGFLTLNSDEGPPPRPFHSLILVKGGSYFSILKAK